MGPDAREMRADWVGTWDLGLGGGKDAANLATGIIRTVYVWILAGHSVIMQCNSLLSCTVNSKIATEYHLFTGWLLVCGEVWTCGVVSVVTSSQPRGFPHAAWPRSIHPVNSWSRSTGRISVVLPQEMRFRRDDDEERHISDKYAHGCPRRRRRRRLP
jgi:hypothetical protein